MKIKFRGDYPSWESAQRVSAGYDSAELLTKVRNALLKVKNGEAVFERDSALFHEPDYPFPIIAAMLKAAIADGSRLSVLDFGGSLGSSYFQCRPFLRPIRDLSWHIVEQPAQVACGRQSFESDQLRFYETTEQCLSHEPRLNVLLLSGVLPYLQKPHTQLDDLLSLNIGTVIIDRTAFIAGAKDRLTVQSVPDSIHEASYPFWFLSETRFSQILAAKHYQILSTFTPIDAALLRKGPARFQGFILESSL